MKHDPITGHFKLKQSQATETTEVAEPLVNPWHPNAIPPIRPDHPHIVNPTGEFRPESNIDTGFATPAKYPSFKKPSKRKATKKQDNENGRKKKPSLKLDFSKIKKGTTQTRLDRWLFKPKTHARVRFNERVVLKEMTLRTESWTTIPLKGFSNPHSPFAKKRLEVKRHMAREHYWRRQRPTPRNARKVTHILERMMRENTKLGY